MSRRLHLLDRKVAASILSGSLLVLLIGCSKGDASDRANVSAPNVGASEKTPPVVPVGSTVTALGSPADALKSAIQHAGLVAGSSGPSEEALTNQTEAPKEISTAAVLTDSAAKELAAAPPAAAVPASTTKAPPTEPFRFAEDAAGKLQSERLPPPQRIPLENFPWVSAPRAAAPRFPEVLSLQLYAFPVELPGGETRSYPIEHPTIARVLPTLDRPPLPQFSIGLVPKEPEMPIAARSRTPSVNPDGIPELTVTLLPFDVKPVVQDDPSFTSARTALLSPLPFADPIAATPEKLTIPDPFDYLRHVKIKDAPAESLSPAVSYDRPAAIVLPLDKP